MNQDKKIQVVMLASDRSSIGLREMYSLMKYRDKDYIKTSEWQPQHLYFLSDDKPKKGDYWIDENNTIQKTNFDLQYGQKIILSTDKSLGLPEPSQEWIEYFVSQFNNGNIITKVIVEYEHLEMDSKANYKGNYDFKCKNCNHSEDDLMFSSKPTYCSECSKLKVNSDNTINIKSVEETWDDVFNNFKSFTSLNVNKVYQTELHNYFKENYQVPKQLKK